jgi:hypothetical protein
MTFTEESRTGLGNALERCVEREVLLASSASRRGVDVGYLGSIEQVERLNEEFKLVDSVNLIRRESRMSKFTIFGRL